MHFDIFNLIQRSSDSMKYLFITAFFLLGLTTPARTYAQGKALSDTPCMHVLPLFTAANVPALAPEEEWAPLISATEAAPANLPGRGLGQHPMLYIAGQKSALAL